MTVSALAFFIPVQQGIDCYYSFELVAEQINLMVMMMTYRHLLTYFLVYPQSVAAVSGSECHRSVYR